MTRILRAFTFGVFKSLQGGPATREGQKISGSVHDAELLSQEAARRGAANRRVRSTSIGSKGKL